MSEVYEKTDQAIMKMADQCKANTDSAKSVHFSQSFLSLAHGKEKIVDVERKQVELRLMEVELERKQLELEKLKAETAPRKTN